MRRLFVYGERVNMPIAGIRQPDIIGISEDLRLRRFDGCFDFALEWYQDTETVWLVDGMKEPYTRGKLNRMYRYLDEHGELYFIEVLERRRISAHRGCVLLAGRYAHCHRGTCIQRQGNRRSGGVRPD